MTRMTRHFSNSKCKEYIMSRNHPAAGVPGSGVPSKFKGYRDKQPSYGPPIVQNPCRVALNKAISDSDFGKADRISAKKNRKQYAQLSKPELMQFLRRG